MTKKFEMYRCETCGNIVQVIIEGEGVLVCCDANMTLLAPHTLEDEMMNEKHVPVFSVTEENGTEIKVGSVEHPMLPEHYIMFIEAIAPDKSWFKLKYLKPGDKPMLAMKHKLDNLSAKAYCNLHGLWTSNKG